MPLHEDEQPGAQPQDGGATPQPGDGESRQRPPAGSHHGERHPNGWRVTPGPGGRGAPPAERPRFTLRSLLPYAIALAVFELVLLTVFHAPAPPRLQIPYSPFFVDQVQAGNVVSINTQGSTVKGEFRRPLRYPPNDRKVQPTTHFATEIPTFANQDELAALLRQSGVVINAKAPKEGQSFLASLLLALLPLLLIVALFIFIARRAGGGVGGFSTFGKARARRVEQSVQTITFADVAGIDEAKAELFEIVDFLREPDKYRRLGGRIPRGVLLTGPPGTGKTLLARALAGEAQVPFFSISASEFVEMFVGVGAARVRDLFQQAKDAAPAIIFIDELDAIGGKRGAVPGGYGGHDEREQTLNQILTEMDGFDPSIGVIVLSATNRPDVLDPALLRPGRFDRRIAIQPPDTDGRRQILAVHTRSVPLAPDADLDRLASMTVGMVGADLANVVNEAALMAARHDHPAVARADFDDALEKLILGSERRILLSEDERKRSAYHEAGHALVALLTPGSDPVRKVSIIPRGAALGVTLSAPGADRFSYDRNYLLTKIRVGLGGRTAEELVFGEITTGAQNDIKQLTDVARAMVGEWGMSDLIGPVAVTASEQPAGWMGSEASPATQQLVDEEVRRIVEDAHTEVTKLLAANRDRLDALARALLEHETLDESEARAAAGIEQPAAAARDRSTGSSGQLAGSAGAGTGKS
jgi:cell division protease FtsH